MTTTRKHDSQIAPSLIKRNTDQVTVLLGDKGYDDQKVRALALELVFVRSSSTASFRHWTRRGMLDWTPTSTVNVVRTRP